MQVLALHGEHKNIYTVLTFQILIFERQIPLKDY